jgi:ribonuclease P protein component
MAGAKGMFMTQKRYSLPREERIRKRSEFDRVFKEGRRLHEQPVYARYVQNALPFTRIGVAVPNRLGKAAKRNRVRRMIKEAYRLHKHEMPAGLDIIFLPDAQWRDEPLHLLEQTMTKIATRLAEDMARSESKKETD